MTSPELITYIRKRLSIGISREVIARTLNQNGWSQQDLNEAFAIAAGGSAGDGQSKSAGFFGLKILLSFGLILASAGYAFFQYSANAQSLPPVAVNTPISQIPAPIPAPTPVQIPPVSTPPPVAIKPTTPATAPPSVPAPAQTPTPAPPVPPPAPLPPPKPAGQYVDGTYVGTPADAYYGLIQVQAIIQGGKIVDVQFLQHPSDRRTSQYINSQAMPILTSEAIQIQNANVDIVSGATDSSQAFRQSLGSALALAKN